ncbi:hypothetical protein BH10PAT3_BH10PAT3_3920 [soil metagenome]
MGLRHIAATALITATPLAPAMSNEAAPAFAEGANRICVDINGGPIDSTDNLPVIEIQHAVGATADGDFGQDTCTAVWGTLIQEGHLTGTGTTLKMSSKVLGWLDINPLTAPAETAKHNTGSKKYSCAKVVGKCVEIEMINGRMHTELFDGGKVTLDTLSNTGMAGVRTRNGSYSINAAPESNGAQWLPKLISPEAQKNDPTLLPRMIELAEEYKLFYAPNTNAWIGAPRFFDKDEAMHFRVSTFENSPLASTVQVGNGQGGKKSVKARLFNPNVTSLTGVENNAYTGYYASHGCDHVPAKILEDPKYSAWFKPGVPIKVNDQPTS